MVSLTGHLSLAELVEDADDPFLPMANTRTYNLRQKSHNRTLVAKTSSLTESDLIKTNVCTTF